MYPHKCCKDSLPLPWSTHTEKPASCVVQYCSPLLQHCNASYNIVIDIVGLWFSDDCILSEGTAQAQTHPSQRRFFPGGGIAGAFRDLQQAQRRSYAHRSVVTSNSTFLSSPLRPIDLGSLNSAALSRWR